MRTVQDPQMEFGAISIEKIKLDPNSRHDVAAVLRGLQHLYADQDVRKQLFALLEEHLLPGVRKDVGRPGMKMWNILVMALLKQACNYDLDALHHAVNTDTDVRQFLGHGEFLGKYEYKYQTVVDNVNKVHPDLMEKINQLFVESGHKLARRLRKGKGKQDKVLRGRCDSFVVETDVHYPTDVNLLWDSVRTVIRLTGKAATKKGVGKWRQWKKLTNTAQVLFQTVRQTRQAKPADVAAYLAFCRKMAERAEDTLPALIAADVKPVIINDIEKYLKHTHRQIDQVDRRLLQGEKIPQEEKVFSVFEEHTRWISKGKAGCPVELGVPTCILEDHYGFVLHHAIMWTGSDVDYAVPMVEGAQEKHPDLRMVSFDRGFHSPANRLKLDQLLDHNALPKKGRRNQADRAREEDEEFVKMRRKHPAVEAAINNLEQRGLDRIRAFGPDGFARMVSLSVVALNVHRIGLLLRREEKAERKRQRKRRRRAAA